MPAAASHTNPTIAVVIPCYRVSRHVLDVIRGIGPEASLIVVVDDACPERSGTIVAERCADPRVVVEFLPENRGVGGAVLAGYRRAIACGAGIIVKLDGDGQMNPELISQFVAPILEGEADYTKGNRFFDLESLRSMPTLRLIGNAGLSFISKLSSGYWKVMDPTNGYTAIDARVAANLPSDKIASRYFFESDMLFRLNTLQASIVDIPMDAVYGSEKSNLKIRRVLFEFPVQHAVRFCKRIFYSYFLRDFNAASVELVAGCALTASGMVFGLTQWAHYSQLQQAAPTGTVLLATIQVIVGVQLLLSWITFDLNSSPQKPISGRLRRTRESATAANLDTVSRSAEGRQKAVGE
jgi:dolichol-phosphate mannosyltransferase